MGRLKNLELARSGVSCDVAQISHTSLRLWQNITCQVNKGFETPNKGLSPLLIVSSSRFAEPDTICGGLACQVTSPSPIFARNPDTTVIVSNLFTPRPVLSALLSQPEMKYIKLV